uniref:Similarity n=1 Tax=Microcystis aeruginosa (strain PCC 7806) TaxID=267872 RepID=A8YAV0_MICA7|nr:unnamed protein product [Microcystis aeruginosa PCC 7806]
MGFIFHFHEGETAFALCVFVNGNMNPFNLAVVLKDLDQILLGNLVREITNKNRHNT